MLVRLYGNRKQVARKKLEIFSRLAEGEAPYASPHGQSDRLSFFGNVTMTAASLRKLTVKTVSSTRRHSNPPELDKQGNRGATTPSLSISSLSFFPITVTAKRPRGFQSALHCLLVQYQVPTFGQLSSPFLSPSCVLVFPTALTRDSNLRR